MHTLLVDEDGGEVVLVTVRTPEAPSEREAPRSLPLVPTASVERRLQVLSHVTAADVPAEGPQAPVRPQRAGCRYAQVDDDGLRRLRELDLARAASEVLQGRTREEAERDLAAAVAAIPEAVAAERRRASRLRVEAGRPDGPDPYSSWGTPASLALLRESHADLAARIDAATRALGGAGPGGSGQNGASHGSPGEALPSLWRQALAP